MAEVKVLLRIIKSFRVIILIVVDAGVTQTIIKLNVIILL
jgi:hypothetical protein